jgi:ADP-ribosylation factor GTPase-activating protein 2/3
MVVIEDAVAAPPAASNNADFFSSFEGTAKPALGALSSNPFSGAPIFGAPAQAPPALQGLSRPLGSAGASKQKPKGLGAVKTANFNFDEAEAKAKAAEETARVQLTMSPVSPTFPSSLALAPSTSVNPPVSTPGVVPSQHPPASAPAHAAAPVSPVVGPGIDRLGMGMGKLSLNSAVFGVRPPMAGYTNNSSSAASTQEAQQRFVGAKSISSDQYFARGNHAPTSEVSFRISVEDDKKKLNHFFEIPGC